MKKMLLLCLTMTLSLFITTSCEQEESTPETVTSNVVNEDSILKATASSNRLNTELLIPQISSDPKVITTTWLPVNSRSDSGIDPESYFELFNGVRENFILEWSVKDGSLTAIHSITNESSIYYFINRNGIKWLLPKTRKSQIVADIESSFITQPYITSITEHDRPDVTLSINERFSTLNLLNVDFNGDFVSGSRPFLDIYVNFQIKTRKDNKFQIPIYNTDRFSRTGVRIERELETNRTHVYRVVIKSSSTSSGTLTDEENAMKIAYVTLDPS